MAAATIQEFLVGLGYEVDQAQQRRFNDALIQAKAGALALAASLAGVVAAVEKVASSYEKLLYASQRIGASVSKIQDFAHAISQVGGSAQAANSSLEAMGSFLRSSPGAESFLARLGVQTRDASGGIRDTTDMLQQFFKVARTMPYFRAKAYAGVLGIDETTLQAGIRGIGQFSGQLQAMYRAAGISGAAAAKGSALFMQQLRALGAALQVLRDKVALSLERGVGGDIERLRKLLVDNFGRISAVIVTVSKFVIGLGDVLARLTGRAGEIIGGLIGWFEHLDGNTQGWIKTLGALLVAWRLLNLGFLATPLGQLAAVAAAIALIYDDYRTWQEGGKHLIDWDRWKPGVDAFLGAAHEMRKAYAAIGADLEAMWPKAKPYLTPLVDFWKNDFLAEVIMVEDTIRKVAQAMQALAQGHWGEAWKDLKDIGPVLGQALNTGMSNLSNTASAENKTSGGALARLPGQLENAAQNGWSWLTGHSRGERNNNPLNLEYRAGQQGSVGSDGRFGRFGTMADGVAAAERQLLLYKQRGTDTLSAIIAKWAPPSENDTAGYIKQVSQMTGLDPNARVDVSDPSIAGRIIAAMSRHESGVKLNQIDLQAGVALGIGQGVRPHLMYAQDIHNRMAASGGVTNNTTTGGSPHINANTTIHVNGSGQPDAVARSVARQQDYVVASLVRNMGPLSQ